MRRHRVMVGNRVLYYAAQLSHAQRFARARQAEGIQAYVVPDPTPQRTRTARINSLTGKPYNKPQTDGQAAKRKA
ncbi:MULTISPECIES: hypothetical protein [Acetobacter]|uniref:hypothetical protein n=1 Tax=Acetobacter TaxID=434 RepID=UPI00376FF5BD